MVACIFLLFNLQKSSLFHSVCKFSTSLELSNLLSSNLNLLLGGGVDAFASGLLGNGECAEANQLYLITSYESVLDGINGCVESLLCFNLCQTSTSCNLVN